MSMNSWYSSSASNSPARHVTAPPSAVVKFFTAWKLNVDRSATCPARLPWRTLPSAWAESDTTAMRPMASWRALAGDQAPPNASMAANSAS